MHKDAHASEKLCCRCQQSKPIEEFAIKNKATGQRQSQCRACQKEISRAHYLANRDAIKVKTAGTRERQQAVLRGIIAERLSKAQCACGSHESLTFQVNPGYQGPRASAVANAGMSEATLEESMANSSVMCKRCQQKKFGRNLVAYNEARAKGTRPEPKGIPKSEYKRRHTGVKTDLRTLRFEREQSGTTAN